MQISKPLLVLALVAALIAGCGGSDDSPTGPEDHELVGNWAFQSSDLMEVSTARLVAFLTMLGTPQADIDANIGELIQQFDASDEPFEPDEVVTLTAGNTWTSSDGESGTWRTDGNMLHIGAATTAGTTDFRYVLSGNQLTLVWTKAEFLRVLLTDDSIDAETIAILATMLQEQDEFSFVFTRTG